MQKKPSRRRPPPRPYHHGDLRRAVLDDALALIGERGHLDFTLREIARRIGVSHAAPYRHFSDKRALVTALAAEALVTLGDRIQAALDTAGGDLRARFVAAGRAYVRFGLEAPAAFRAILSGEIEPDDAALAAAKSRSFGLLLRFIAEAQRARAFPAGDPREIAISIWAMHHGLATLAAAGAFPIDGPDRWRMVDDAHARLLDGLVVKKTKAKPSRRAR